MEREGGEEKIRRGKKRGGRIRGRERRKMGEGKRREEGEVQRKRGRENTGGWEERKRGRG